MQMSQPSPAKSPTKPQGVKWWQPCVRSFVTPYGEAKEAPEPSKILNRLQPFTCEWLTRPDVALSEYADTITWNIPLLEEKGNKMLHSSCVANLKEHFQPVIRNLDALNKKTIVLRLLLVCQARSEELAGERRPGCDDGKYVPWIRCDVCHFC